METAALREKVRDRCLEVKALKATSVTVVHKGASETVEPEPVIGTRERTIEPGTTGSVGRVGDSAPDEDEPGGSHK